MNDAGKRLQLHDFELSGHCHRVRLMLSLLGLPFDTIPVDLAGGEHKRAPFLSINPFGQVPVLKDGDITIADSTAILTYLARRYGADSWLPTDPVKAAAVQRWLSVASGELAFGPAQARAALLFGFPYAVEPATALGHALLKAMNEHLASSSFLAGPEPTIADVACYAYTAHAPEGRIPLDAYPHVRAWLARVESLPGFVAMPRSPIPAKA
jgi:glutathione S-transferase